MKVIKRDGRIVEFDRGKIEKAIEKAFKFGNHIEGKYNNIPSIIASQIETDYLNSNVVSIPIKDIEDKVYDYLVKHNQSLTAKSYEGYRAVREYQRRENTIDEKVIRMVKGLDVDKDNSNKSPELISTMRDLTAEIVSKDIALKTMLPPHITHAHNIGLLYIHDLGHYLNPSFNCELINLKDMLENGTVINGKLVERPRSFRTACTIATQVIAQVASGQFGGQTISLAHLSPFVRISKEKIKKEVQTELVNSIKHIKGEFEVDMQSMIDNIVESRLKREITDGIQTFQYQINTLQTSNGQSPFLSVFMYINEYPEYEEETVMLIEEMLRQRIKGMKNKVGAYISPAFPKLLYVADENNIHNDSKYFYLTELASECIAKRMMPDILSAKILKQNYEGNVVPPMGCRAFLSPYKGAVNNIEGEYKLYGRFNMGLTTINLADAGLSAKGNLDEFWKILEERLELCKESLLLRYDKLKDVTSDVSPIHWQYGAIARLPEHAPIKPLLQDGYATISLGYIGIYECVKSLLGCSHTTPEGEKLALQIMNVLKQHVLDWKSETGLGFALYGTPSESLTERFAKLTRERWGKIEGITDRDFLTNSYHVFVEEPIDIFSKFKFESQFHSISSGGAISYGETPNMINNTEAIVDIIKFIYDNVQYGELNTKLDHCMNCGFEGEVICNSELIWTCPNCGNNDPSRLNILRRSCGYLGENLWCEGRTREILARVLHI